MGLRAWVLAALVLIGLPALVVFGNPSEPTGDVARFLFVNWMVVAKVVRGVSP